MELSTQAVSMGIVSTKPMLILSPQATWVALAAIILLISVSILVFCPLPPEKRCQTCGR